MKSGFACHEPSRRWDGARLAGGTALALPLFVAGGAVYQVLCDALGGRFGAAFVGFVAMLGLLFGASAVVRRAHCRNDDAGMASAAVLAGGFWLTSWAVALRAAAAAVSDGADLADALGAAFSERREMRDAPWLTWIAEVLVLVGLPWGGAGAEADKPYCEDVGAWAAPRTLGVAKDVDGAHLRRAAMAGDLVGLFAVAAGGSGKDKARFELLTAPGSSSQFLNVVLLETPTSGKRAGQPADDDDTGTDVVEGAVLTSDERAALEDVFGAAAAPPTAAVP